MDIVLTHVSKTFKSSIGQRPVQALSGLCLEIRRGEVFGIIGRNGAGKSTTLKILMGFLRPDQGEVLLAGRPPTDPAARNIVGFLPENPCLYDNLTAREHLEFALRVAGMSPRRERERIDRALARVSLLEAADRPVRKYSKGMVQRAALAYALVHEPDILVLDEPMSGLDPLGRHLVVELIQEYHAEGHTILFSSHILTDVERMCDRIAILDQGQLKTTVTPDDLTGITDPAGRLSPLEHLFLSTIQTEGTPQP
ncbi:MAG TPA: ABC transporter ATP-binding protein [Desulfobacterales bacterium]|nr:ABC transporter ATP-binding protein [Desulfobacterales bacterium]